MEQAEEPDRPKAVTIIGWVWIVLAVIFLLKALTNLIAWAILHSASPGLLRQAEGQLAQTPFLVPVARHAGALFAGQALLWAVVGVCAWNLLRLRRWARVATQAVCWLNLVYVATFLVFWAKLWPKMAAEDPSITESHRSLALFGGIGACILLGAALGVMLRFLRSTGVRTAFAKPPSESPPAEAALRSGGLTHSDRR